MDLIYTNAKMEDQGVLLDYSLDLAFGADENDFECTIQADSHCCSAGSFLYIEGTEYGGIVDSIESNEEEGSVIYRGRTWHGILNAKVLQPDPGKAYLTVNGEANTVIGSLLERMGLTDLFRASPMPSGVTVKNYKMNRYILGYDGIKKMLKASGGKLKVVFVNGMVMLSATSAKDYSKDEEFDSDLLDFQIKKNYKSVNHLVCLGTGNLEDRMVIHLYADAFGRISRNQTQFGMDEYAAVYDYPNVESEEELLQSGTEELQSLWGQDELSIAFDAEEDSFDIGDIVGAIDNITGIQISAEITKKIVSIENGQPIISYEVGD